MVPSCPAESIITLTAFGNPVVAPRIPAMKVCVWVRPMRMVSASALAPPLPIWILLSPARTATPALEPNAMLPEPVVFVSALAPMAVLLLPVVFAPSAP